jgi:hypothetical protein
VRIMMGKALFSLISTNLPANQNGHKKPNNGK